MNVILIKNNDMYEIEIPTLIEMIQKIKSIKGYVNDPKTRLYSIPESEKDNLIKVLQPITNIEVKEQRDVEPIFLEVEKDDKRIYAKILNYFRVSNFVEPVFQLFKTIKNKKYDDEEHKWSFPLNSEETLKKDWLK